MKVDKVFVEKIILKIDDEELELSIDKARQLQKALDEVLGKEKEYVPQPYVPYQPYIIYPTYPKDWEWYTITWGNNQYIPCSTITISDSNYTIKSN